MRRFLDLKNDFAFKRLFGTKDNKGILIAFLNAIFEGIHKPILDVEFLPTVQNPEIAFLKESIVDVLCHDTAGKHYIVEMQCSSDSFFLKRACYYASKVYTGQIQAGQPFSNLKEVIFFGHL